MLCSSDLSRVSGVSDLACSTGLIDERARLSALLQMSGRGAAPVGLANPAEINQNKFHDAPGGNNATNSAYW